MAYDWKNKVVLITGAARGIGASVVRQLMDEDVKHVAVLDVVEDSGVELQTELNKKHGLDKVKFYKCDITKDDQFFGVIKAVKDEYGYIDVVINNAGIMNDSMETYKKEIDVNVTALVTGTLKALEMMRKDAGGNGGTVINISSIAGLTQTPALPVYWATKAAVIQFSNCIGNEDYYSLTGVRVITICFGATETPLIAAENLGSYDKNIAESLHGQIRVHYPVQSKESAAKGLIEAYKQGESSSTWLIECDEPARDITNVVKAAYGIMSECVTKLK